MKTKNCIIYPKNQIKSKKIEIKLNKIINIKNKI